MFHEKRIKIIGRNEAEGKYILYWVHASPRCFFNPALEFAINKSVQKKLPLLIIFIIDENFTGSNYRHFKFLMEGLEDFKNDLKHMNLDLKLFKGDPVKIINKLQKNSSLIITDKNYIGPQKIWLDKISENLRCSLFDVETNVSVPVEEISDKEEYSAATFRRKYWNIADDYLDYEKDELKKCGSFSEKIEDEVDFGHSEEILSELKTYKNISTAKFKGGHSFALKELNDFKNNKLDFYSEERSDPSRNCSSNMSPYLHFGQISPLEIVNTIKKSNDENSRIFLEELLIRRELAINFCYYNQNYYNFNGLNEWAKKTLNEHRKDQRDYLYSTEEFENAQTHDIYWNAAQMEMVKTGKMSGYMRMYWGKKILEWSTAPEEAIETAIELNNKYELDGRDPNGYAGIMWCLGKHDRAWAERKVYGKIRYMNSNGLKRKFKMDSYVNRIKGIVGER